MAEDNPNKHVADYLRYFAGLSAPGFAVLFRGPWGSGKTFQVRKILKEKLGSQFYRVIHVSVYGLTSAADIDAMMLEAHFPLLKSRKLKVTGRLLRQLAIGRGHVDPNIFKPEDIFSIDPANLYVFDDLERAEMPIDQVLGYINKIVEHENGRVVLIANEDEISGESYKNRKEKLIGQTLEVVPDLEAAFSAFVAEKNVAHVAQLLQSHKETVFQIFRQSGLSNLRLLRQVISDFSRLQAVLDETVTSNADGIKTLIQVFFALGIEFRAGRIGEGDLATRTGDLRWRGLGDKKDPKPIEVAAERYSPVNIGDNILTDDVLVQILAKGVVETAPIKEAITGSPHFAQIADDPAWRRVWWGHSIPEADFEKAVDEMENQFKARSFLTPGELLHVFGLRIWLSDIGVLQKSRADVEAEGISYIDDLYAAKSLPPLDAPIFDALRSTGYGGLIIQCNDQPEYRRLYAHLRDMGIKSARDQHPEKATTLLEIMRTDVNRFALLVGRGSVDVENYQRIPIFASMSPAEFAKALVDHEPPAIDTIFGALRSRYEGGRLGNELAEEEPWLKEAAEQLQSLAIKAKPLKRHIVTEYTKGLLDRVFGNA